MLPFAPTKNPDYPDSKKRAHNSAQNTWTSGSHQEQPTLLARREGLAPESQMEAGWPWWCQRCPLHRLFITLIECDFVSVSHLDHYSTSNPKENLKDVLCSGHLGLSCPIVTCHLLLGVP